jgi:hypothetical protein
MRIRSSSAALALAVTLMTSLAGADLGPDARVTEAKQLFARYVALEHAFDPAVAELYADDAVIRNTRTYPTGQTREMTMPAPQYKAMMRAAMPLARARGDVSTYSQVSYAPEADGVRIKADRFSELKKYHSPLSLLVKPSPSGSWLIYQELSESQP